MRFINIYSQTTVPAFVSADHTQYVLQTAVRLLIEAVEQRRERHLGSEGVGDAAHNSRAQSPRGFLPLELEPDDGT